jgi:hypothetical protein
VWEENIYAKAARFHTASARWRLASWPVPSEGHSGISPIIDCHPCLPSCLRVAVAALLTSACGGTEIRSTTWMGKALSILNRNTPLVERGVI